MIEKKIEIHDKDQDDMSKNSLGQYIAFLPIILIVLLMVIGTVWADKRHEVRIPLEDGYLFGDLLRSNSPTGNTLIIFIAGSGPTDRDGNSEILGGKNDSIKTMAYSLQEMGFSSFRYDQRSAGKTKRQTTKDLATVTFEDMVTDLIKVIETMKNQEKFDTIILVGHSQGALVAALAAAQEPVNGYISLCGATRPVDEVLTWQLQQQNLPEFQEMKRVIERLKQGKAVTEMSSEAAKILGTRVQPFLISWMAYDPNDVVEKLTIPKLYIFGSEDLQVPSMEQNYLKSRSEWDTVKVLMGMNHVLKQVKAGDRKDNLASYSDPSFRLHNELLSVIGEFAEGVK